MIKQFIDDKNLNRKCLYTFIMLVVAVALSRIPVPGIDTSYIKEMMEQASILGFMDTLSGGSLSSLSFAAFGITSYITASIVIQMMTIVVPALEKARRSGESGKKRLDKATLVLAIIICTIGSVSLAISLLKGGMISSVGFTILAIGCWIAGTVVLVMLGKKNDDFGIGNGISLILLVNILSRIPANIQNMYHSLTDYKPTNEMIGIVLLMIAGFFLIFLVTVYLQTGVLNIRLQQIKKSTTAYNREGVIPMGVNMANVMPIIFASSLLSLPAIITMISGSKTEGKEASILAIFNSQNWYTVTKENLLPLIGLAVYAFMICAFSYFYSNISFNAHEIADRMKKNGDVIPGVNPGTPTVDFLEKRRKILVTIGIFFLLVIAIIPDLITSRLGVGHIGFLGTSLIIIVNVLFDTGKRLKAATMHIGKRTEIV